MARRVIYIEQTVLDQIARTVGASSFTTEHCYYLPLSTEAIELVVSPRPVPREHLRRDLKATLDDLETNLRHLRYMQSEI